MFIRKKRKNSSSTDVHVVILAFYHGHRCKIQHLIIIFNMKHGGEQSNFLIFSNKHVTRCLI